jgi:hypothetical protein
MSYTVNRDGPSYASISEALAACGPLDQVWIDGQELTRDEAEYMADRERNAPDPEEQP